MLLRKVETAYRRKVGAGEGVLLAVSGGADSTALLTASVRVAATLGVRFEVATLDHGLRAEAAEEVSEVERLGRALGLDVHVRRLALRPGAGVEARARAERYKALEALRAARGLRWIATAHTADDQAETLLLRLGRGASLKGAASILEARGCVLRPMLQCRRAEVERFLEEQQLPFVRDPMNADPTFARVRVRQQVVPALATALGPRAVEQLARFASDAAEDEALLAGLAEAAHRRLELAPGVLDAPGVRALLGPVRRRVVVRLLEEAGIEVARDRVDDALRALRAGTTASLGRSAQLRCEGARLRVHRLRAPLAPAAPQSLELDGPTAHWEEAGLALRLCSSPPADAQWFFSLEPKALPLRLRVRRPGDRAGRRKVHDVLVDHKVPRERRDAWPLVCNARGEVLAVAGLWPNRRPDGGLCLVGWFR